MSGMVIHVVTAFACAALGLLIRQPVLRGWALGIAWMNALLAIRAVLVE